MTRRHITCEIISNNNLYGALMLSFRCAHDV